MADPWRRLSARALPAETRVACRVEYDGSAFNGWQLQPQEQVTTVQGTLERALSKVADTPVRIHCAGRTDAGVHAFAQIIHFDPGVSRSCKSWQMGANANLPDSVRIHWAESVPADFHARFSALSRRYRYVIANAPVRSALLRDKVSWCRYPLDEGVMHREAQALIGEHDFSAFRAATCQSETPMREVQQLSVFRRGELVVIDIQANAFLHHMVRNIAGSLMAVGSGRQSAGWMQGLLRGRDRTVAADTASAAGLYLVRVFYPDCYRLPGVPEGPMLLAC